MHTTLEKTSDLNGRYSPLATITWGPSRSRSLPSALEKRDCFNICKLKSIPITSAPWEASRLTILPVPIPISKTKDPFLISESSRISRSSNSDTKAPPRFRKAVLSYCSGQNLSGPECDVCVKRRFN